MDDGVKDHTRLLLAVTDATLEHVQAEVILKYSKPSTIMDHDRDLHAKFGELAVANDFLARKLKPWIGK